MADPTGYIIGGGSGLGGALLTLLAAKLFGLGGAPPPPVDPDRQKHIAELLEKVLGDTPESITNRVKALHDWHEAVDPTDPVGALKIRFLPLKLREVVNHVVVLLGQVVERFDVYNVTNAKLIQVIEALRSESDTLNTTVTELGEDVAWLREQLGGDDR